MNCDQAKTLFSDYWSESLSLADEAAMEEHIAECALCSQEAERLGRLWRDLALIPAEEPTPALRTRFYDSLRAYGQGTESAANKGWRGIIARFWPQQPVWQMALSLGCLAAGLGLGLQWDKPRERTEVARLKADIDSMRQLVVLSLLRQESASERLRGVSWANQVARPDTDVVSALIESVNHDPNVNVRLAAVSALRSFSGSPLVRQAISPGIAEQSAPLVQVALIELAVDLKEREAAGVLRQIVGNNAIDPGVKERANWALERLQ